MIYPWLNNFCQLRAKTSWLSYWLIIPFLELFKVVYNFRHVFYILDCFQWTQISSRSAPNSSPSLSYFHLYQPEHTPCLLTFSKDVDPRMYIRTSECSRIKCRCFCIRSDAIGGISHLWIVIKRNTSKKLERLGHYVLYFMWS